MLAAVRAVGATGLETDISILTRSIIEGTNGNEDYEAWVETSTVKGWIKQNDRGPVLHLDENNGVVVSIGRYRIHLPPDTNVDEGDMLGLDGEMFIANEVNSENTYRVFTTVIARKRD
jgi:hypothetical protein